MNKVALFKDVFPFQTDVLTLPVGDINVAAAWYSVAFGMTEISRSDTAVILERDGVKVGFEINGRDPEQDGAAVLVADIHRAKTELTTAGVDIGDIRIDERDGKKYEVFFVVAPDALCFYFHQLLSE